MRLSITHNFNFKPVLITKILYIVYYLLYIIVEIKFQLFSFIKQVIIEINYISCHQTNVHHTKFVLS